MSAPGEGPSLTLRWHKRLEVTDAGPARSCLWFRNLKKSGSIVRSWTVCFLVSLGEIALYWVAELGEVLHVMSSHPSSGLRVWGCLWWPADSARAAAITAAEGLTSALVAVVDEDVSQV